MKYIIWIIGSMASGKSTQRRLLCANLSDAKKYQHEGEILGVNYSFATFGNVAALGKIKDEAEGMCDGLDAAFGTIKKEGGQLSLKMALDKSDFVIIEGSQTSLKWFDFIKPMTEDYKAEVYLIHLKLDHDDNLMRLRQRQANKNKWNPEKVKLSDKNIESIIGKNVQFNNIFDKLKDQCHSLQIDATENEIEIFGQIIDFIFN